MMNKALEQYKRVLRYYERLNDISAGVNVQYSSTAHYDDDVLSFFIHCYHMRDWIISDSTINAEFKEVDGYIREHPELCICADLCNGIKHVERSRKPKSKEEPKVASEINKTITVYPHPQGGASYQAQYKIDSKSETLDALKFAGKCIELWENFLVKKGVKITSQ